jgi:hypothetical protein
MNDFLRVSGEWHDKHASKDAGILSEIWYRGVHWPCPHQAPGVYRTEFSERAEKRKRLRITGEGLFGES